MSDQDNGAPLPPSDSDAVESALDSAAEAIDSTVEAAAEAVENVADAVSSAAAGATAEGSETKTDVGRRVIAYLIDGVIAGAAILILMPLIGVLASLVGAAYILVRDGLDLEFMRGRSIGKRLMKLTVVRDDGAKMDITTSVKRNIPLAIGTLLGMIPGMFILSFVAAAIAIYEIYLVLTKSDGRRWGDTFAGTKVVEAVE